MSFVDFRNVWLAYNDELLAQGHYAVEDISLRVLPSLLQVPAAVLGFRLRTRERLDARRSGHLRASLWSFACALLCPRRFGYFVITARKQ